MGEFIGTLWTWETFIPILHWPLVWHIVEELACAAMSNLFKAAFMISPLFFLP